MTENFETIENTTTEDNTVTTVEEDERQELMEAVNDLAEEDTEPKMNLANALKMGVGFAAGYVVGSTVQKVKNGKKHPEDLKNEPKEHFWKKIHFQSPIKFDKKEKPVEGDSKTENENPTNPTPGKDQEKK